MAEQRLAKARALYVGYIYRPTPKRPHRPVPANYSAIFSRALDEFGKRLREEDPFTSSFLLSRLK